MGASEEMIKIDSAKLICSHKLDSGHIQHWFTAEKEGYEGVSILGMIQEAYNYYLTDGNGMMYPSFVESYKVFEDIKLVLMDALSEEYELDNKL